MATKIYVASSLDGYIADANHSVDWLLPFQTIDYGYEAFLASCSTIIMGSRSYQTAKVFGNWPYPNQKSVVLTSQTLTDLPPNTKTANSLDAAIEAAKSSRGDTWIMGGSQVMGAFLDANAIDHMEIYVIPILIGSGTPLFTRKTTTPIQLTLTATHQYQNGVVRTVYQPA